jgi:MoxR-like ATPase
MADSADTKHDVEAFQKNISEVREQVGKVIVGNREIVDGVLTCMLAGSHALLEGVPGLGKTMLVRTLSQSMSLDFSRIQFTPDLMPADIIGTVVFDETKGGGQVIEFRKGPLFANMVLADEINRATPKTQSALLEAMQEHRVTVGGVTHKLEEPYFVLATQNPIEMEGTYPLPEAQLDRFFFKLQVPFPTRDELHTILERTTTSHDAELEPVLDGPRVVQLQNLIKEVPAPHHVQDYAVRLVLATHPDNDDAPDMVKRFVRTGASPRGAQALLLASKIGALIAGRFAPAVDDIRKAALPALRHRVLLNFEGEAESISADDILGQILEQLPETKS